MAKTLAAVGSKAIRFCFIDKIDHDQCKYSCQPNANVQTRDGSQQSIRERGLPINVGSLERKREDGQSNAR